MIFLFIRLFGVAPFFYSVCWLHFFAPTLKHTGELELHTQATKNASYIWQMVSDPIPTTTPIAGHSWQQIGVSTKASFTVNDLITGIRYWFRYALVSRTGQSAWSDPISKIASL